MKLGYARVSTEDQDLALQKDALKKAGCEQVYSDKASGAKTERPQLTKLLSVLKENDTLVVWKLDRLGRSLKHLIDLVKELEVKGIAFQSLTESIDTTTNGGKLIFHIFGALAEFERGLIQERTKAGLKAAKARGKKGGRPKILTEAKRQLLQKLYDEKELSIREICESVGVSRATFYNYLQLK